MKKSIVKRIAVLAAIGVMTMTGASAAFAGQNTATETYQMPEFSDQYAVAHINPDGYSGYILINDTSVWDQPGGLTQIAGIPLSDIIRTCDGGKAESINISYYPDGHNNPCISEYSVDVYGKGGNMNHEGNCSKAIYFTFTDCTNDTYDLFIYNQVMGLHYVGYDSSNHDIVKIEWLQGKF